MRRGAWPGKQTFGALGTLLLLGAACAGDSLEQLRRATYPPDFHYITQQEIHTKMGALASEVDALDQIMWKAGGPTPEDRTRVVEILSRMRTLAAQLKRRPQSNHPEIQEHAPRLRQDVERALAAAKMEPPNYYYAGVTSGSCTYCHAPRHRLPPRTER